MSDSTKAKADAISAPVFTKAYLGVHADGGTIADLAEMLDRSINRFVRNAIALPPN